MPEINTPELHLIYKQIKTHPETWQQGTWAINFDLMRERGQEGVQEVNCGTACCIAGHAVARAGYEFVWPNHSAQTELAIDGDGNLRLIETLAAEILGLDENQADELFSAANELDEIRELIIEFTGED